MPKFRCSCGNVIADNSIPNPQGFFLVSETTLDRSETQALEGKWDCSTLLDHLTAVAMQAFRCEKCGRLLVFEQGRAEALTAYAREDAPEAPAP